jgi:hypothetical protein
MLGESSCIRHSPGSQLLWGLERNPGLCGTHDRESLKVRLLSLALFRFLDLSTVPDLSLLLDPSKASLCHLEQERLTTFQRRASRPSRKCSLTNFEKARRRSTRLCLFRVGSTPSSLRTVRRRLVAQSRTERGRLKKRSITCSSDSTKAPSTLSARTTRRPKHSTRPECPGLREICSRTDQLFLGKLASGGLQRTDLALDGTRTTLNSSKSTSKRLHPKRTRLTASFMNQQRSNYSL